VALGPLHPRSFFERSCLAVAPDLLGATLVHALPDGTRLSGRIVEVEAYLGDGTDPGSHCHRGVTPRNRAMFGPAGRLYVYRSYGIHTCANVVCEPRGRGAAVLLRAVEPLAGGERMRHLRGLAGDAPDRLVASGPGRLCQAFGITLDDYGTSLLRGRLSLRQPTASDPRLPQARSQRVGLGAGKGEELPYRFYLPGHSCVSGAPRT